MKIVYFCEPSADPGEMTSLEEVEPSWVEVGEEQQVQMIPYLKAEKILALLLVETLAVSAFHHFEHVLWNIVSEVEVVDLHH